MPVADDAMPRFYSRGSLGLTAAAMVWPVPACTLLKRDGLISEARGSCRKLNEGPTMHLWPTPRANDAEKRGDFDVANPRNGLPAAARTWPTPTCQDSENNGSPSQHRRNSEPLNAAVDGPLNPAWVEWLMGWSMGWTDLAPLEAAYFDAWTCQNAPRTASAPDPFWHRPGHARRLCAWILAAPGANEDTAPREAHQGAW